MFERCGPEISQFGDAMVRYSGSNPGFFRCSQPGCASPTNLFKHQRYLVSQFVSPSVGHTHMDLLEPLLRQHNYRLEELSHTISTARRQKH